jgi:type II secretory pathway predicted ATPase ExeA
MNWLTPAIETNFAYAACMILFGLFVLSVRNRKMAARPSYSSYASPLLGASRPAPKNRPAQVSRRAKTVIQHSGLLLSTGLEYTPREQAIPKAPDSFENPLGAPLIFPALHNSEEVKMNSPSFPFESLEPVALAEGSESALSETASTIHEHIPSLQEAYGMLGMEELRAREIAVAPDPHPMHDSATETTTVAERNDLEQKSIEEVAFGPQSQPVDATPEKTAPANLLEFYELRQQPFDVTPDPAYLYLSPSHRDALATLKQGIEHFRGFMMLVAEPGMGKTTLLNKLMEELSDSARVVFLFQTQCSSRELLCFILNELEVDHTGMDVVAMHRALNQALLEEMLRGRRFVLIVDEAQNLQEPVLETIRLLSDFETSHSKLIQIVLAGQPQIAETLMAPSLVQLRQRIAALANLKPLTPAETAAYIEHRLRAAGWSDKMIFSSDALDQIAESSEGVPRSINNLCFNALLESFHRGLDVVDADIVKEVAGKLNLEALVRPPQMDADSHSSAAPEANAATQLARALAAALSTEARPDANSPNFIGPKPKPEVVLTGNLSEKVRSQGWSKHHEYRILVSLERDPISGIPVAERYYCCSLYVDEAQAAGLKPGKPVRIKIEQD